MTDRCKKRVLTVIATLAVRDVHSIYRAEAQSGPVHVIVDSVSSFALQNAGPIAARQQ
jgi:hypothetical protein